MRSAPGSPAGDSSRGSRRRSPASPSDWTAGELVLASASGVAQVPSRGAPDPALAGGAPRRAGERLGLQELQRLNVQQAGRVAHDVGGAQGLEELLRAVELAH